MIRRRLLAIATAAILSIPATPVIAMDQAPLPAVPVGTTTALESAPNPSVTGSSVTFTATVSPGDATGTVSFTDTTGGGSIALGSASLSGGTASVTPTMSTIGRRTIVATYEGDGTYAGSASDPLTQIVSAETLTATTTGLTASPNPVPAGSQTTLTATVSPIPTTGAVDWYVDDVLVATTPVGGDGKAALGRTWADPGTHSVQVKFVDGTLYADSQSGVTSVTVSAVAYTVTITATPSDVLAGATTTIAASVSPAKAGTIKLYAGDVLISTQVISAGGQATIDQTVAMGTTTYRADFLPTGATLVAGTASTTARGRIGTTVGLSPDQTSVVAHENLVTFVSQMGDSGATGTVTLWDVTGTPVSIGSAVIGAEWGYTALIKIRMPTAGTRVVEARYGGDGTYAPAVSATVVMYVEPDTGVTVSGVTVQYPTFFPYKDGYKDTVAISATPGEPVTATIKIYDPYNRLVKSWTLASRTTAWNVLWNGRNTAGTALPAGKYKVIQSLRDAVGHRDAWTLYITISSKKLTWVTGTITKYADQYASFNYSSYGDVSRSYKYSRGLELYGNIYDEWAWAGWAFAIPRGIQYGTFTFSILGTPMSGYGVPYLSCWNYAGDYEDAIRWPGRSYTWYSTSFAGASHLNGNNAARCYATVEGSNMGWYNVAKVRLTYRVAMLK